MLSILKPLILVILILFGTSQASAVITLPEIDISKEKSISILPFSYLYIDENNRTLDEILSKELFTPYKRHNLNIGARKNTVWLAFCLTNRTQKPIRRLLVPTSARLEEITLFGNKNLNPLAYTGLKHIKKEHSSQYFSIPIDLPPRTSKTFFLRVTPYYNPVNFKLLTEEPEVFHTEEKYEKALDLIMIGMILSLMLYAFFLSAYIKDKSYFYYGLYLFALLYQQASYIGLTNIYFPLSFFPLDTKLLIFKIVLLIVTSALFAMHFLNTRQVPLLHKGYQIIIFTALTTMLLSDSQNPSTFYFVVVTGFIFITYNLIAGFIIFKKGYKQARLFIAGFSLVFITYLLQITDALTLTNIMVDFNNALLFVTTIEAFILSLAFADRYMILQHEKQMVEQQIWDEMQKRADLVTIEVEEKTKALNKALQIKDTLIKEIHHRVKNNLQLILSMIRLQSLEIENSSIREIYETLEQRINTISQTYMMLLNNDDIEAIDMETYIETLVMDISEIYEETNCSIEIQTDIDANMPIKTSVYIGLIINELLTNAYKYAFPNCMGHINMTLKEEDGYYILTVKDDGKGFSYAQERKGLGLKLIHTLVYEQLDGVMEVQNYPGTTYTIKFPTEMK